MVEVDGGQLGRGLMVILVQPVAGDGLGDDALACEGDIVGALEEVLLGVRIGEDGGSVFDEFGTEVGAVVAGEPESSWGNGRVGAADHLELKVRDNGGERHGRTLEEAGVAESA